MLPCRVQGRAGRGGQLAAGDVGEGGLLLRLSRSRQARVLACTHVVVKHIAHSHQTSLRSLSNCPPAHACPCCPPPPAGAFLEICIGSTFAAVSLWLIFVYTAIQYGLISGLSRR